MSEAVSKSPVQKFMDAISSHYEGLGYPLTWSDDEDEGEMLEIQFKSESGYFVSAHLVPHDDHIIFRDEWGREEPLRPTKDNPQQRSGSSIKKMRSSKARKFSLSDWPKNLPTMMVPLSSDYPTMTFMRWS